VIAAEAEEQEAEARFSGAPITVSSPGCSIPIFNDI
jgi:hypothetical protein